MNDLTESKSGSYKIKNFKVNNSLSVGACAARSIVIEGCDLEALDLNTSNSSVALRNNQINSTGTYKRYDGGNNTNALYVYADNYSLEVTGNIITAKDTAITVQGNYEQFQQSGLPLENSIVIKNNTLNAKEGNIFKCYNDVSYAPVEWPADYTATSEMKALAEQLFSKNNLQGSCGIQVLNVLMRANGKSDLNASEDDDVFADIARKYLSTLHAPGEPVIENEIKPTQTEAGSYDLVTYCRVDKKLLSREHVIVPPLSAPSTGSLPKTGDESNLMLFATLLAMSAAGVLLLRRRSANR